jgi:hypothetical protein
MATNQLISISPDGEMSAVRRKRGTGIDLRDFGDITEMRRVSEVEWSVELKGFTVCLKAIDGEKQMLTVDKLHEAGLSFSEVVETLCEKGVGQVAWCPSIMVGIVSEHGILAFEEYEDAVLIEVDYLHASKLNGTSEVW